MVQELERRGAKVCCTYTGGLDFSVPVQVGRGLEEWGMFFFFFSVVFLLYSIYNVFFCVVFKF